MFHFSKDVKFRLSQQYTIGLTIVWDDTVQSGSYQCSGNVTFRAAEMLSRFRRNTHFLQKVLCESQDRHRKLGILALRLESAVFTALTVT
jgi:hypothetical protein